MARCFELESCYPDINPSIFTNTDLSEVLGQYISICEVCYLVKNSTLTNCTTPISVTGVSYDTCAECYNLNTQNLCNVCPEYYEPVVLDDGREVCQRTSNYPATWDGLTATIDPGDRQSAYGLLGLNLLENVTNKQWPIIGFKTENFAGPTCSPLQLDPPCDGPGYWSNWGFKDNWGTGSYVFGQLGYSVFDSFTPTPLQGKTSSADANLLFRSNGTPNKGRLNEAGIWAFDDLNVPLTCPAIQNDFPVAGSTIEQFIQGASLQCSNTSTSNSYVKYDFCFSVGVEREYLIGFAADNSVRIILDNQPFFVLTPQVGTARCAIILTYEPAFFHWHVVPITLTPGVHTITIIGYDIGVQANYAAEVYNLTSQELKDQFLNLNLGSYNAAVAALEPYILFSTKSYIGNGSSVPIGEGTWTCLDGSTVELCSSSGQPECPCISNVPVPSCCYLLTNCQDSSLVYTITDLSEYQGQTITISSPANLEGCYLVEQTTDVCPDTVLVVVAESYQSCETCLPSYILYNCKDITVTIQTSDPDFEQYLGQTVTLAEYPGDCWQVGPNDEKVLPLQNLNVEGSSFENCVDCTIPEYKLTNCVNGVSISSTSDLSAYVGKVIRAENFPGLCFTVTDNLCDCLKITLNGQVYEVNKELNLFNERIYFQFTTDNDIPIVIAYNSSETRWEIYNPESESVYFYSDLNIDCPSTGFWIKLDPDFPGNVFTETCPLTILGISPTEEFVNCEPCVNC